MTPKAQRPLVSVVAATLGLALLLGVPAAALAVDLPTGDPNLPEEIRFYHADALGSIRAVSDTAGSIVARYDYFPFGEQIPTSLASRGSLPGYSADAGNKHRFTAKERDFESGLDYFGARYFSGPQGRFTSPDLPFADQSVLDPQSWNLYSYARNNPLRYRDSDGRAIETLWDAANVAMDVASLVSNVKEGNWGSAAVDAGGLIVDALATAVPLVPGGAGMAIKAARAADKVVDAVQAADNAADTAKAAGKAVGDAAKFVPNPGGKLGGAAHRAKVAEVAGGVRSRGLEAVPELRVSTPGGHKSTRYVDVAGRDPVTGQIRELHQVGKQTKSGAPVSREAKALDDIRGAKVCGAEPCFHPYNK